ncbi:MAG: lasso peptide biosynthesis B2 protein [Granulicella sp.]
MRDLVLRNIRSLNRFMGLAESERWLIVETTFYLCCAKVAARAMSTRTLLALGSLDLSEGAEDARVALLPPEIAPAIHALDKSSRRLPFANCLIRALALRMLLARRDIATELHIGARKDEQGQFAAHAWLTCNGTILVGGDDATDLYRELVGSTHALLQ